MYPIFSWLCWAIDNDFYDLVKFLVETVGVDVNNVFQITKEKRSRTVYDYPFHVCLQEYTDTKVQIIKFLVEHKIDLSYIVEGEDVSGHLNKLPLATKREIIELIKPVYTVEQDELTKLREENALLKTLLHAESKIDLLKLKERLLTLTSVISSINSDIY